MQLVNAEDNKVELTGLCMTVLLTTAEYTLRFPTLQLNLPCPLPSSSSATLVTWDRHVNIIL